MLAEAAYYNRAGAEALRRRLADEVLLAQGPMGTVLMGELDAETVPPAFWNLAEPSTVQAIHRLYEANTIFVFNVFNKLDQAFQHNGTAFTDD